MAKRTFIESRDEMEAILGREEIGYLGLLHEGQPYVVPLNYAYVDGRILFHGAFDGQKMDCLKASPEVCFTVACQTGTVREHGTGELCHVDSDSVICYGRAREITNPTERQAILDEFNRAFRPDAEGISLERTMNCAAVEITVTEMTGRRERERDRTLWRHRF